LTASEKADFNQKFDFRRGKRYIYNVDKNTITSPIEQGARGRPSAITMMAGVEFSVRQQALLDKLPEYDSRATVKKSDVSMADLSALTAKTGVEFAMFTRKQERLIVRGDENHVNVTVDNAAELNAQGYKWSGHTHVGLRDGWELSPSDGDREILSRFNQKECAIYNVKGESLTFVNDLREE